MTELTKVPIHISKHKKRFQLSDFNKERDVIVQICLKKGIFD